MASIVESDTSATELIWLMALAYSTAGPVAGAADGCSLERVNREDAQFLDAVRAAAGRINADVAAAARVEVLNKLTNVPKIADFYMTKKFVLAAPIVPLEKINDPFGPTSNVQPIGSVIVR